MSEGLNRVTLLGNATADAELRYTQGGQPVMNTRIAIGEKFKNREGEWQERTEYVSCVLWGKRGESVAKYISKGSRICVEGRLQTRSWEAKDGGKRYTTEVVATNIILLGGGSSQRQGGYDDGPPPPEGFDDDSDSIPF